MGTCALRIKFDTLYALYYVHPIGRNPGWIVVRPKLYVNKPKLQDLSTEVRTCERSLLNCGPDLLRGDNAPCQNWYHNVHLTQYI